MWPRCNSIASGGVRPWRWSIGSPAARRCRRRCLEQIVAKTDGVPLFVEELTKTVLESGLLREEGGAYVLATALTPLAIPSTLQDSLMARLDRLAPVKEIAQIGAAIGREFSYRCWRRSRRSRGRRCRTRSASSWRPN